MNFYSETISLSNSEFTILRDLIHEHLGLFYDQGKREQLADKLCPLLIENNFSSFLDFYYLLRYDELSAEPLWARMADVLSVPETYFWREIDQIHALVRAIVPAYFAANLSRPLRIWSVGCATGEEPLTIAMALSEAGWLNRGKIEIYAGDFSRANLAKAQKGLYRERSFRSLPAELKERYFTLRDNQWQVDQALHSRIRWLQMNLRSEQTAGIPPEFSVIFCRNVFIYFSETGIRDAVDIFFNRLATPGHLFVGAAESLLKVTNRLELQEICGAFVYVKH
ncbi:MAG: MCP methyltransferase, CheR-type [uncultured bacterium]|nr:MAG: MCP methyltransferase, CheR-type [uncultured bacterium]